MPYKAWVVTEDLIGLQNQAIGLAEALNVGFVYKAAPKAKGLWRLLPSSLWPSPLSFQKNNPFKPPWPWLLISCGRSSVPVSLAVKKASGGKTFTVHIQDPLTDPEKFDAVIVPAHDRLRGSNVLPVQGALHRVTQEKLERGAGYFHPLFADLRRPLIAVLVGGKSRHQAFPAANAFDLARKLGSAVEQSAGGLAITFSRRTGTDNEYILRRALKDTDPYIWDGKGENPYFGLLALADAIVVTSDSISMISEACFTGKPVYVYELSGGSRRHRQFKEALLNSGKVRPFMGRIDRWRYQPLDETQRAADFVRRWLAAKTKEGAYGPQANPGTASEHQDL